MFHVPALCSDCNEDFCPCLCRADVLVKEGKPGDLSAMVKNSFVIELPGKF